jgi:glycosyltransferase involved in cell wall biosynthesis
VEVFQGADLFCLPSHSENFGLAVLEACQVGTPVLTTDTTPWGEHLADGRGYICSPNLAQLKEQLSKFLGAPRVDAEQRQALSDWAWRTFEWKRLAERYIAFYRELPRVALRRVPR